jgi:RNA-directed DNA polymerase
MQDGVGQLSFTFGFPDFMLGEPPKDETEETQVAPAAPSRDRQGRDVSGASIQPVDVRRKPERKKKWHSLIDKVYALKNLQSAWERVRTNDGAPGLDGMTIEKFAEHAEARLQQLSQDLRAKTYRPQPVRRVFIPKSGGGQRPLGIPTIRDRIVQQALRQVLEPIFDGKFSQRSHGFRPGRGCNTALEVVDRAVQHGYEWVVDADIQRFFDTVDHEKLLDAVNEEVADGSVLKLIRRILQAGVSLPETAEIEPTELGTPQGGPLSPLLANIYLHAFDETVVQAGYGLVRYADDFVIFAKSEPEAAAARTLSQGFLEGTLGLRLHPEKTRVVSVTHGFEFLGFHYFREAGTGELRKEVRRKSVQRFRDAVRARTPRYHAQRKRKVSRMTAPRLQRNPQVKEMIRELNVYLRGWHGYFKSVRSAYPASPFRRFDQFVRRRVRAALTGEVGNGWQNQRLPNRLLEALGLASLDGLQKKYRAERWRAIARKGGPRGEPYTGKPYVRFG